MRLKTLVLCSSSMLVATAAVPSWAQTAPTGPVQTESVPNDPEAAAPQQDDAVEGEGEEIVVTGIRRSLQSAQNLRRTSEQIVDAVVAEDIGKLPDLNTAQTAARIPGVQVYRQGGEAQNVLVRGCQISRPPTTVAKSSRRRPGWSRCRTFLRRTSPRWRCSRVLRPISWSPVLQAW